MSTQNVLTQINQVVDDAPLEEILEIAETVLMVIPIPGLPLIVKILRWTVRLRPVTSKALGASTKLMDAVEDAQRTRQRNDMIESMIAIACEDGVIDDDEETYLRCQAAKIGENPDEFMKKVRSRLV